MHRHASAGCVGGDDDLRDPGGLVVLFHLSRRGGEPVVDDLDPGGSSFDLCAGGLDEVAGLGRQGPVGEVAAGPLSTNVTLSTVTGELPAFSARN